MGRKNHQPIPRQRSNLEPDQEVLRAANAPPFNGFGIRRLVSERSSEDLIERTLMAELSGELHPSLSARNMLSVTYMPKRRIGAQIQRGIVIGNEIRKTLVNLENDYNDYTTPKLAVDIGEPLIVKNAVGFKVENELLDQEHHNLMRVLGEHGIKGVYKEHPPMHVSLATSERAISRLSKVERNKALDLVAGITSIQETVSLEPVEFYGFEH